MAEEVIDLSIDYSEEDTKRLLITKQLENAGWTGTKVRMEVAIKAGRIIRDYKRQPAEFADYVLYFGSSMANKPIAAVEAKKLQLPLGTGRDQAIDYAQKLGARFAFATNGTGFVMVDLIDNSEKNLGPNDFPTVEELTNAYLEGQSIPEKAKEYNFGKSIVIIDPLTGVNASKS